MCKTPITDPITAMGFVDHLGPYTDKNILDDSYFYFYLK